MSNSDNPADFQPSVVVMPQYEEMMLRQSETFDAIVVGSGISGGWAAKELTEKGLKTLVLERGRMVRHGEYPTATTDPWDIPFGNRVTQQRGIVLNAHGSELPRSGPDQ